MFASPAARVLFANFTVTVVVGGQTPVNTSSTWTYDVTVFDSDASQPLGTIYWYFGGVYAGSTALTPGPADSGYSTATKSHTWTATPGNYEVFCDYSPSTTEWRANNGSLFVDVVVP